MRIGAVMLTLAIGACAAPRSALAYGALAVGVPSDVSKNGFAYGINVDSPTEAIARETALRNCRGVNPNSVVNSQPSDPAKKLCTLVTTFHHQCAVVAQDPASGTPGVGWAVAPTLIAATQWAIENCRATAGAARKEFCKRDSYNCDTK